MLVYLIHFDRPFGHARHYIGVTRDGRLDERLAEHSSGRGANLIKHVIAAGIGIELARTWPNVPRCTELRLKAWGGSLADLPDLSGGEEWP